jgi:hypothetical protein
MSKIYPFLPLCIALFEIPLNFFFQEEETLIHCFIKFANLEKLFFTEKNSFSNFEFSFRVLVTAQAFLSLT